MKTETIVNAMFATYTVLLYEADNARRLRQYHAFRDRIIILGERERYKTYTLEGKIAQLEAELNHYQDQYHDEESNQ